MRFGWKRTLIALITLMVALPALAAKQDLLERSFCVFDPVGANGPLFAISKSFGPSILKEGVKLSFHAYTDEKIAVEDFKAGVCDAVLITGTRAREFNKFTGSLEAVGGITSEKEMRMVFATLMQPKAKSLMVNGEYEVVGVFPAGGVYLFTNDRSVDTVNELQGKKIATLDHDKASLTMVRHVGASPVGSNAANFAGKFNNGSVDLAYAPAVAYTPMELYKGLKPDGGILHFPIAYMNFQVLIRQDRFPENAGKVVKEQARTRIDEVYKIIEDAEAEIPQKYWMYPAEDKIGKYERMLQQVRLQLRDEGVYDPKALRLMRVIRCKVDPTAGECANPVE
ncbi:DUF6091 family protein [Marinobacteraceae bacterium S3BR75-40.1]